MKRNIQGRAVPPKDMPMTDAQRPWLKHPVSLIVGALVVAASGCGSGTAPSPSTVTVTASTTTPPATTTASTAAPPAAPGPQSKMLPEIALPAGSTEYGQNTPDDETWYPTTPYDQTVAALKPQLPIGQTFHGVPFCKGDVGAQITQWDWATDTEDLAIFVQAAGLIGPKQEVEFRWQAIQGGGGREGCTAPLPATVSAEPPPSTSSTSTPAAEPTTTPVESPEDKAKDESFAAALTQAGIPFNGTSQDAMVLGNTVCVYLGQADTDRESAAEGLVKWRPQLSLDQARTIIPLAISTYCPGGPEPWGGSH
jgi:hypothetical protein